MAKEKETAEWLYPLDELMERSEELYGCRSEIVAGAAAMDKKDAYGYSEMKQLIQDFRGKKVN